MDNESGKKFNLDDYDGGNHDTMTLTLDDGTDLVCNVLKIFSVNDKQYVALLPRKQTMPPTSSFTGLSLEKQMMT